MHDRTALKMSSLDWEQVIRVDLSGPFSCPGGVPALARRGFGRIVMISSYSARAAGSPGQLRRRQAGQFGLTKVLALETATEGITVNCVVSGGIETTWWRRSPRDPEGAIDLIRCSPGKPDDVAEAVRYLVSDEAHYLTGALIPVAGELLMM